MLNVKQLRSLPVGLHSDKGGVPGLYLQVSEAGRSWVFIFQLAKRRRTMGLGSLEAVSLAEARDLARGARSLVARGIDPIEHRDAERAAKRLEDARAVTFKQAAEAYIKANQDGWKNEKHAAQWPSTLKTYAYPIIGHLPVAAIDTDLVLKCLEPIWRTKPETASRVRGRIEAVLSSAIARGQRPGPNPAVWRGLLDQLLPARAKVRRVKHQPALPYAQIPDLMQQLAGLNQMSVSSLALRFTILTAARTGEVIGAKWPEFDLAGKVWTVPASRMKAGKAHRVPLSEAAMAIIEKMRETVISAYVFPGWKHGQPLSDMALLMCLRGLRPGYTVHGTARSSFKDWCSEKTSFPDFLSEMALAHVEGDKARAAYARSDLQERRRQLMEAWAGFCAGKKAAGKVA